VTYFRFDIGSRSRNAGRLIGGVRRELLAALTDAKKGGLTQEELARRLDLRRPDVNRQFSGEAELSLRSLADLAWALDRDITIELRRRDQAPGQNIAPETSTVRYKPVKVVEPRATVSRTPAPPSLRDDGAQPAHLDPKSFA
jgi:transcriptional regulator with XRE-family HTH domain